MVLGVPLGAWLSARNKAHLCQGLNPDRNVPLELAGIYVTR